MSPQKLIEDTSDDMETIFPIHPKFQNTSNSVIESEQKVYNDDFHLPGFFPKEDISPASNSKAAKGYAYVDEAEIQLPSNSAMEGSR
ncbi:hypothetical protein GcM1_183036 [Golovinomyces cichoracearum]|uniref:Uncharacterized protein n=1 Tax=Golovinomyces cichoracearum TaxID=62708 RepID=A0A420J3N7_9PEZI|nr:hypothetical protein GcM1_183036 [Golovinomyces cichoracearum]